LLKGDRLDWARAKALEDIDNNPGGKNVVAVALVGKTRWVGINNHTSHPDVIKKFRNGEENSSQHAETNCIIQIPRFARKKVKLYVARFLKNGDVSMAKPCEICQKFLVKEGIDLRNVFYSTWEGKWERLEN